MGKRAEADMRIIVFILVVLLAFSPAPAWAAETVETAKLPTEVAEGGSEEGGAAESKGVTSRRFIPKGNGTVLDSRTGLIWLQDANVVRARIHQQAAREFINEMNGSERENFGHTDWRMPSVEELRSLVDQSRYYPALPDGHIFKNVQNDYYWTSTGGFDIVGYVWMIDMSSGNVRHDYVSFCNFMSLWPVRGAAKSLPSADDVTSPSDLGLSIGDLACKDVGRVPDAPLGISATAVSSSEIVLTWARSQDDSEIAWYNIYENNTFVTSSPSRHVSFKGLEPGVTKCYRISSFNSGGVESRISRKVCSETWRKAARGTVWSSGLNQHGQMGDGTSDDRAMLVVAMGLSDIVSISAGVEHVVAVKSDGTVWAWGRNQKGQLGDGTRLDRLKPVKLEGLSEVVDVSAGWYHTAVLKSDGTVWAWGRNYYGQLGNGENTDSLEPIQVKDISGVVSIAAGWYHTLALRSDGTVWAWGWNRKGQLGNDSAKNSYSPTRVVALSNVDKIAAGMYHSLAVKRDGKVWAWGWNEYGQLGTGNTVDSLLPVYLKDLSNIIDIAGGMHYTVALRSDGSVLTWGRNEHGQLGIKGVSKSLSPVLVKGFKGVEKVGAGAYHSVALKEDGTVWLWGWNYGKKRKKAPPMQIGSLVGISSVVAGKHFTNVIKER
jgi:hypothetical protein